MKILIAEDDAISRRLLDVSLRKWGHEVLVTQDGAQAWECLSAPGAPHLAILDWMMPGRDGVDICRGLRQLPHPQPIYIILLTARDSPQDLVQGLRSGADDYLTKPFDPEELKARIHVGERLMVLQAELGARVRELEEALANVKQLQGLLPMCSYCKKIRDDNNYWHQVEHYIAQHSTAKFSHGMCPDCYETIAKPQFAAAIAKIPPK